MNGKSSNHLLRWLLALNLIVFGYFGVRQVIAILNDRADREARIQKLAKNSADMGVFSLEDALKDERLSNRIGRGGRLSDAEMDWCLMQMNRSATPPTLQDSMRRNDIINTLRDAIELDCLTPVQRERLTQALMEQLAAEPPGADWAEAMMLVAKALEELEAVRALPLLRSFANSPHSNATIKEAVRKLEALQLARSEKAK